MPRGVYRLIPGLLERDDLVSFCLEEGDFASLPIATRSGSCPNGLELLLKRVAGMPGDRLETSQDGIAINGRVGLQSRAISRWPDLADA